MRSSRLRVGLQPVDNVEALVHRNAVDEQARDLLHGVTVNRDKAYYDFLQTATLQDVVKFQQQWVKGRTYHFAILGDKKHLDMKALKQMGEVIELTTEEIFGY